MKRVTVNDDYYNFLFDSGVLFVVSKSCLLKGGMLNPDLIITDEEFKELNDFLSSQIKVVSEGKHDTLNLYTERVIER